MKGRVLRSELEQAGDGPNTLLQVALLSAASRRAAACLRGSQMSRRAQVVMVQQAPAASATSVKCEYHVQAIRFAGSSGPALAVANLLPVC